MIIKPDIIINNFLKYRKMDGSQQYRTLLYIESSEGYKAINTIFDRFINILPLFMNYKPSVLVGRYGTTDNLVEKHKIYTLAQIYKKYLMNDTRYALIILHTIDVMGIGLLRRFVIDIDDNSVVELDNITSIKSMFLESTMSINNIMGEIEWNFRIIFDQATEETYGISCPIANHTYFGNDYAYSYNTYAIDNKYEVVTHLQCYIPKKYINDIKINKEDSNIEIKLLGSNNEEFISIKSDLNSELEKAEILKLLSDMINDETINFDMKYKICKLYDEIN